MHVNDHPSGWDTGFFRMGASPEDQHNQLFIHLVTREVKSKPYDTDEPLWEPLYVYLGTGDGGEPAEVEGPTPHVQELNNDPRYEYNLNDKQVGLLLAIYMGDTEAMGNGPTLGALTRRKLTVGQGRLELTELGKKVAKQLDTEAVIE